MNPTGKKMSVSRDPKPGTSGMGNSGGKGKTTVIERAIDLNDPLDLRNGSNNPRMITI